MSSRVNLTCIARPRVLAAGGLGPVLNKARQRAAVDIFGQPLNVTSAPIVSAGGRRVGDHTNPILQPWAAEVVKEARRSRANNPQQSWGFEGEPPEAVIKDYGTRDGTS
jgi:hypothetical protein